MEGVALALLSFIPPSHVIPGHENEYEQTCNK